MSRLKKLGLVAWYYGSMPYRAWAAARMRNSGGLPIAVVCYHRVADSKPTDWSISNAQFERQLDFLRSNFDLVSLAEAQRRVREGDCSTRTACITFDDGYAENFEQAIPLLVKLRVPFTYFVTHHHMLTGSPFPHDVANGVPLAPNTLDQVRALADAGVEIGAHTRTHVNLGTLTAPDEIRDEVLTASCDIQAAVGAPIRYFAFPYGWPCHLNAQAIAMLRNAGFAGVCSAFGDYNYSGDDPFHIRRSCVDSSFIRTANWLTLDPRKIREGRRQSRVAASLFATQANAHPESISDILHEAQA